MPDRRPGVLWLTLGLTISLLLGTGIGYFVTGGAPAAYERQARVGLWAPRIPFTPNFADPAPALAPAANSQPVTADGVANALAPLANDPRFAGKLGLSVVDVATGESLYGVRSDVQVTPASTTKIVTAMAALAALGPYHRFTTRVVEGSEPGEIVLIGGGDPTLAVGKKGSYPGASRLDALAKQVKAAGPVSRIVVDSSLFTGPDRAPGWDPTIVNEGFVAPVNALTINGGRLTPGEANTKAAPRTPTPDLFAGQALAKLLDVPPSAVSRGTATEGARELGRLASPPLQQLVEQMLQISDNVIAESLLRQVAVSKGKPATFEGGQEAARQILSELGLDPAGHALVDGSGLSRQNKISPALLTAILHATTARPERQAARGPRRASGRGVQRHAGQAVRGDAGGGGRGARQDGHASRGQRAVRRRDDGVRAAARVRGHRGRVGAGR